MGALGGVLVICAALAAFVPLSARAPRLESARWLGLHTSRGAWSRHFLPASAFSVLLHLAAFAIIALYAVATAPGVVAAMALLACLYLLSLAAMPLASPWASSACARAADATGGSAAAQQRCPLTGYPFATALAASLNSSSNSGGMSRGNAANAGIAAATRFNPALNDFSPVSLSFISDTGNGHNNNNKSNAVVDRIGIDSPLSFSFASNSQQPLYKTPSKRNARNNNNTSPQLHNVYSGSSGNSDHGGNGTEELLYTPKSTKNSNKRSSKGAPFGELSAAKTPVPSHFPTFTPSQPIAAEKRDHFHSRPHNNNNSSSADIDYYSSSVNVNNGSPQWTTVPVVFVTAHPDDEAMFFTPVLTALMQHNERQRRRLRRRHFTPAAAATATGAAATTAATATTAAAAASVPLFPTNAKSKSKSKAHVDSAETDTDPAPAPEFFVTAMESSADSESVALLVYAPHVLCLSTGAAGAGDGAAGRGGGGGGDALVRCRELQRAAALLGVALDAVRIINDPALPDGMDVYWDPSLVQQHIERYIAEISPAYPLPPCLVTFDSGGVSGHPNHAAVAAAVAATVIAAQASARSHDDAAAAAAADSRMGSGHHSNNNGHNSSNSGGGSGSSSSSRGARGGARSRSRAPLADSENNGDDNNGGANNPADVVYSSYLSYLIAKTTQKLSKLFSPKTNAHNSDSVTAGTAPVAASGPAVTAWMLTSRPLAIKYLGPLPVLFSVKTLATVVKVTVRTLYSAFRRLLLCSKPRHACSNSSNSSRAFSVPAEVTVSSLTAHSVAWAAMRLHFSQFVWFRRLYLLFSTYTYTAPLTRLGPAEAADVICAYMDAANRAAAARADASLSVNGFSQSKTK